MVVNYGFALVDCFSFLSQDKMVRKPVDPEEELRWMSQEVRGYVEAVLNSLAANVPKVVLLLILWNFNFQCPSHL